MVGPKDNSGKDSLRASYGVNRLENAYFNSETYEESLLESKLLFNPIEASGKQLISLQEDSKSLLKNHVDLAMIVISPSLVANNEFVYVIDDFFHSKFNICALKKKQLGGEELK